MEGGEKTKRVDKKIDVIRKIEGAEYKREPWGDQRDGSKHAGDSSDPRGLTDGLHGVTCHRERRPAGCGQAMKDDPTHPPPQKDH